MKKLLSFLLAFVLLVANNPVAVMAQGIPAELSLPAAKVEPQDTPAEGEDPPDRAGEPEVTEPEDITVELEPPAPTTMPTPTASATSEPTPVFTLAPAVEPIATPAAMEEPMPETELTAVPTETPEKEGALLGTGEPAEGTDDESALSEYVAESASNADAQSEEFIYTVNDEGGAVLTGYTGMEPQVSIPTEIDGYTVVEIGGAFKNCTFLESVICPDAVVEIGGGAFAGCTNLQYVELPANLKYLRWGAFEDCASLTEIEIPKSLEVGGYYNFGGAFTGSCGLKTVTFEEGTTHIAESLFCDCESLERIVIPEGVTEIYLNAFCKASNLKEVVFPQSLKIIGSSAFSECVNLNATLVLPDSITEIRSAAFSKCEKLADVELPVNLEKMGRGAFGDCPNLTEIEIPRVLQVGGYYTQEGAFSGTTGLKTVSFEEGTTRIAESLFCGCESLENIVIPEGVTEIGPYAFTGATNLKHVEFPESLIIIEAQAFDGCTNLADVWLPGNLQKLGGNAFSNCPQIKEIVIPKTLTSGGYYYFYGAFAGTTGLKTAIIEDGMEVIPGSLFCNAKQLETVIFPDSVKELGDYLFLGCDSLQNVVFPAGLQTIRGRAFEDCISLEHIELPEGLVKVSDGAFDGCTNLQQAYVPISVAQTLKNVFSNCPNLTILCKERSLATIYAIDNGIPVQLLPTTEEDKQELQQIYADTKYVANAAYSFNNGYMPVNIRYSFREDMASAVDELQMVVRIPENVDLLDNSLQMNGTALVDFLYNEGTRILAVPCTETQGEISFTVKPLSTGNFVSYCYADFEREGVRRQEVMGIISEEMAPITLQADTIVGSSFCVRGIGPAQTTVSIYLNGALLGQAQTNRAGNYQCELTLPEPEDYMYYTLSAKVTYGNEEYSATCAIQYREAVPQLTRCQLTYDGVTYDMLDSSDGKIVATYYGLHSTFAAFRFEIDYTEKDKIGHVYVASSRGGLKTRMEAIWDEEAQAYVAEGTFNDTVPGTLSVEYTEKEEMPSFSTPIDYSSPRYVNATTDEVRELLTLVKSGEVNITSTGWREIEDSEIMTLAEAEQGTVTGNMEEECEIRLEFPDKYPTLDGVLLYYIKQGTIHISSDVETAREELLAQGYTSYIDDDGIEMFVRFIQNSNDTTPDTIAKEVIGEIVDLGTETIQQVTIDTKNLTWLGTAAEGAGSISKALGYANDFVTWDNNRISLNSARQQVLDSSRSEAEKSAALQKLQNAEKANNGVVAATVLNMCMSAVGLGMPFPASLILPLYAMSQKNYVAEIIGGEGGFNSFVEATLRDISWIIDPAGYVYDAATKEALQGVTTTAYWIELDPEVTAEEYEAFWATPPAEDEYGALWQAEEWGQKNPLQTDQDGYYQWDVPEGWWRVQYEKEGYETAWSDWLPVPPPQTDVNIALKPEGFSGVITSDTYEIVDGLLYLSAETTANTLLNGLVGTDIGIAAADGAALTGTALVGTGAMLAQGGQEAELTVVFYGDLTGDGKISSSDMLEMQRAILGISKLEGVRLKAATPRSGDSEKPQTTDMLQMRRVLLGIKATMLD